MNAEQRATIRQARDAAARAGTPGDQNGRRDAGGRHSWPLPTGIEGRAVFSADGEHRYILRREWDVTGPICMFVGLNPSTAAANVDDPTVRKCWRYASEWGHGSMVMLNIFAFRATNPAELEKAGDLVGDNEAYLEAIAAEADMIVVAWGNSKYVKAYGEYEDKVCRILLGGKTDTLWCLGTCQDGSPRHPLYMPNAATPQVWRKRSAP